MVKPLGLPFRPGPSHFKVLPQRHGNIELLGRPSFGSALVEQRFERAEILILNRVPQGIEIVSHDLCFPGNVFHSLLTSSPRITCFPSCIHYLLDHSVTGYLLLFLLPSPTHQILVGLLLGAVSDIQNDSVILLLGCFFFPSQQNASQHVVMEVSVLDQTSASVKKDILVLSVNKWTETSAE